VSLLTLDISGSNLSKTQAAVSLAEGLAKNMSLQQLNISRTKLTDDGMKEFCTAVETNVCLEHMIFHCNPLSKKQIASIE
jgi:hypothetical protein